MNKDDPIDPQINIHNSKFSNSFQIEDPSAHVIQSKFCQVSLDGTCLRTFWLLFSIQSWYSWCSKVSRSYLPSQHAHHLNTHDGGHHDSLLQLCRGLFIVKGECLYKWSYFFYWSCWAQPSEWVWKLPLSLPPELLNVCIYSARHPLMRKDPILG